MKQQLQTSSRVRWFLTNDKISHLERMADNGVTLTAAAREMGVDRKTLLRAAERIGKLDWLKERFPPARFIPGSRKKSPPPRENNECYLRAATMAWR